MNDIILFVIIFLILCIGYAFGVRRSNSLEEAAVRRLMYRSIQLLNALTEESDLNERTKRAIDKCYEAMDDYFDNID